MIFDSIVSALFGFLSFVLDLLPTWSAPGWGAHTSCGSLDAITMYGLGCDASSIGQKLGLLHRWIDTSALVTVLALVVTVWIAMGTLRLVLFVYGKIPGKAS
jgi:hypothetical protein